MDDLFFIRLVITRDAPVPLHAIKGEEEFAFFQLHPRSQDSCLAQDCDANARIMGAKRWDKAVYNLYEGLLFFLIF